MVKGFEIDVILRRNPCDKKIPNIALLFETSQPYHLLVIHSAIILTGCSISIINIINIILDCQMLKSVYQQCLCHKATFLLLDFKAHSPHDSFAEVFFVQAAAQFMAWLHLMPPVHSPHDLKCIPPMILLKRIPLNQILNILLQKFLSGWNLVYDAAAFNAPCSFPP